jgi:hypothetical protein
VISREDMVEQSVTEWVRNAIFVVRGFPASDVELRESFPHELGEGSVLGKNLIAAGYDFDDGGEQAELGSDLMVRRYTIEFFVFGQTRTWAKNLANNIKFALDVDGTIPLLDISQVPPVEIDRLVVISPRTARQPVADPEPWQEFIWTTTVQIEDTYHAALV